VDRLIGAVAGRQYGVIAREQLVALGLGRGAVEHRVRRGLLRSLHRGVYLWGRPEPDSRACAMAAVLACGEATRLSHGAGAALWEMRPVVEGPVDVTLVGDRARHAGIRVHQTRELHPADATVLHGVPVTSAARTLLDIAATLAPGELAGALEQAQVKRLVSRQDIDATLRRSPRRPGSPVLRALVAESTFTRSAAERILAGLVRAAGLPCPAFNAHAEGYEVDALWRIERVVLEFDSYAFHATRAAFERDRGRDATLTRAGYVVLRTTWLELTNRPHALVARIAEALALAKARRWAA